MENPSFIPSINIIQIQYKYQLNVIQFCKPYYTGLIPDKSRALKKPAEHLSSDRLLRFTSSTIEGPDTPGSILNGNTGFSQTNPATYPQAPSLPNPGASAVPCFHNLYRQE
ncbi:hypothetical protein J23TS9_39010 [Paenibacillus sp. J23TS9]|nr:hypothetical protein J23TS9_39010 [Paenibacillus sp. J23TS9]